MSEYPRHLYAPMLSCTCVCFPHMIWMGGIYAPVCLGLGGSAHHVRHFSVCQYIHCLLVHQSHASCSPSLWVASLLDWMLMDVCYVSCCCTFLCSFIMSQASTTMAMTTTPPMTVASSVISSYSSVTMVPFLMGLPATSCQHDVVLPPLLTPRHSGGVIGFATVPQHQPPSQMPLQAFANYVMGSPQVGFFQSWACLRFVYYMFGVCSSVCILISGAMLNAIFTYWGSTFGVCTITTLWTLSIAGICATWWWSLAHIRYAQNGYSIHYFE